jgi:tRNA nucleotidyltransferase (CCA-adding enzyme)
VLELCSELERAGHRAWVVGGCIRDVLRGETVSDWDLATSAEPREVMRVFRRTVPTGIQHGTVTVLWKDGAYEVTTLRGEGAYSDGRRPDEVRFVRSIEDDLARRDFTVNAIAYDPLSGEVVDPYGGLVDIDGRILRAVGEAERRFSEDGLRILRAARFVATLEFELEPVTEAAIEGALPTFRKVSAERVQQEWMKAFKARTPSRAFEVMRRTGMLEVTMPELLEQVGCEQNHHHAYDVWKHTMECLDASPVAKPSIRLAALLHDVGKPRTRARSEKTGEYTFYHHEQLGADMADRWLKAYRFGNDVRDEVVALVRHHLVCYSAEWTDAAVRRFVKRVEPSRVPALLSLARADVRAKGKPVDPELALLDELEARVAKVAGENAALSTTDLAIDGGDVMRHLGIAPSRRIGVLLEALLERVLENPQENVAERLLLLLEQLHREIPETPASPRVRKPQGETE